MRSSSLYRRFVVPMRDVKAAETIARMNGWSPVWTPTRERVGSTAVVDSIRTVFGDEPPSALAMKWSVTTSTELSRLFAWTGARTSEVWFDAEDDDRYKRDLWSVYKTCRSLRDNRPNANVQIFYTVQTVRRDAETILESLFRRSQKDGIDLGIKLVRGAYARRPGTHWTVKTDTDACFQACLARLFDVDRRARNVHATFATHNRESIDAVIARCRDRPYRKYAVSIAQLRGFETQDWVPSAQLYDVRTQLLVPFGTFWDSVPYLLRRVRENPSMLRHLRSL